MMIMSMTPAFEGPWAVLRTTPVMSFTDAKLTMLHPVRRRRGTEVWVVVENVPLRLVSMLPSTTTPS